MTILLLEIAVVQLAIGAIGWLCCYPSDWMCDLAEKHFGDWGKMIRKLFIPQLLLFMAVLMYALISFLFLI